MIALLSGGLAPFLRLLARLVTAQAGEPLADDWIPHTRSPLGSRRTRELARRGAFVGARKVGRIWLIPRAVLNAYVERAGATANDNGDEGASEAVSDLAREMGYSLSPSANRRRRGTR
ncbi:MAG: hypothetical protein R3F14_15290 [Polyangiaceae bacterium]